MKFVAIVEVSNVAKSFSYQANLMFPTIVAQFIEWDFPEVLKFDGELAFLFPSSIPRPPATVLPHLGRPRIHPSRPQNTCAREESEESEGGEWSHKHLWQFNDAAAAAAAAVRATAKGHLQL